MLSSMPGKLWKKGFHCWTHWHEIVFLFFRFQSLNVSGVVPILFPLPLGAFVAPKPMNSITWHGMSRCSLVIWNLSVGKLLDLTTPKDSNRTWCMTYKFLAFLKKWWPIRQTKTPRRHSIGGTFDEASAPWKGSFQKSLDKRNLQMANSHDTFLAN